jgi:oligopeptide/dipeptide ABC transporter ATP-binding protein
VLNLLRDLQDEFHLSYLFVAHDLSIVRHVSHRVAVMYLGRVVEVGPEAAIFDRPAHPYTRALLDAVPDPSPDAQRVPPLSGDVPNPLQRPRGCHFHPRCPQAQARCGQDDPPLLPFGPGHEVRCFYPSGETS